MKLHEVLLSGRKSVVLIGSLLAIGLIGVLDFQTRWEFSFFAFYAIPIFLVAWTCPPRYAVGYTLFCAAMSWAVNLAAAPSQSIHAWRSLNRLVAFSFVATAGSTLRAQRALFLSRLEAIERSRELEQEILRISERQQRLIGQELHDSVCQDLAAMDCAISLLKSKLQASPPGERQIVEEIQGLLQKSILETRSLARGIFPVHLEKEGVAVAIEELVRNVNRHHNIEVKLRTDGEISIRDPETAMHLYRISQEALNNAVRHSKATAITVSLQQNDNRFAVSISDNGVGIPANNQEGMGLRTISYRARLIDAELTTRSSPSAGTFIQCSLALPNHDNTSRD